MTAPLPGAPVIITPAMRAGVLHAIRRLDQLAEAHRRTIWRGAYETAAAALREELKIAGENEA